MTDRIDAILERISLVKKPLSIREYSLTDDSYVVTYRSLGGYEIKQLQQFAGIISIEPSLNNDLLVILRIDFDVLYEEENQQLNEELNQGVRV